MLDQGKAGRVAIIGMGPRGLGALDALARRATELEQELQVDVFETGNIPGPGPNFHPDQSDLCLLNIPLRSIELGDAAGDDIGPGRLADWAEDGEDGETYPPRAFLGAYLARWYSHLETAAPYLHITHHRQFIRDIRGQSGAWYLRGQEGAYGPFEEVLLTQGQPETDPDPQIARWQDHLQTGTAKESSAELIAAYPANRLMAAAQAWRGRNVAIRGLGLSTLDVLRLLTLGQGGHFAEGQYHPSGDEPARILPFSLDGHAPVPKPDTAELDARFNPTDAETRSFERELAAALRLDPKSAVAHVAQSLLAPTYRILSEAGVDCAEGSVEAWLETEREHPGAQECNPPVAALRHGIEMAMGTRPPSPGYVIGQVWRKWQNTLRQGFNPGQPAVETAHALVGFDEGLKRFSYGPPVCAAREMLMLIEVGLVDLHAADDPDVLLTKEGWQLLPEDESSAASVMVDAVLPPPSLDRCRDPLIMALRKRGHVTPFGEGMGARMAPDGRLIGTDGHPREGLSLLGRLALGDVVAVDSIHDCFGAASARWAEGAASRLVRRPLAA
ncbi:FAD/NAD(P)-binding protein [Roseovarius sp. C7]|uniref:FAD/NAD(P)-binding protein n=1 Tax=Roseovarius sp. C7 TaxID=3398643 RepID=UPI0039F6F887